MTATPPILSPECDRCGAALPGDARFCSACGANVGKREPRPSGTSSIQSILLERVRHVTKGEFEIHSELGRGGMATVFLGHEISLDRKVAIKVMSPDLYVQGDSAERFKREARTAANLSHANIIPIYTVREIDDILFFVMKFVEGRPLDVIVSSGGKLPFAIVEAVLLQVGSALDFAHRKGVVHRDIKPANILIDEHGLPIVTDFGIAKVAETHGLTMPGGTMGTPSYMSPEQCVGGQITGRSDQYSLGIVAYQMLTGLMPFEAETAMSYMWAHVNEPPRSILEVRSDTPRQLAEVIMRMLSKDPDGRWPSFAEAAATLGRTEPRGTEPTRVELAALATEEIHKTDVRALSSANAKKPKMAAGAVALVTVSPPAGKLPIGETLRLTAVAKTLAGEPVSATIEWRSSVPSVAAVSSDGLVTGVSQGEATITASCGRTMDVSSIRVTSLPAAQLKVTPSRTSLKRSETVDLKYEVFDAQGRLLPNRHVKWVSSDPEVASVSQKGTVVGVRPGSVLVAGTVDGKRAVVAVTVEAIPLAALLVTPREATIGIGESIHLNADPVDEKGVALGDRVVTWTTSDAAVVSVATDGVVTGESEGTATITAECEDKRVSVTVASQPVPIASLITEPTGGTLVVEQRIQLHARPLDASGRALLDRDIVWSSSDESVVSVTATGAATALATGHATVTASCEDHEATIRVMVTRVGVSSVEITPVTRPIEVGSEFDLEVVTFDRFRQMLRKRFIQWQSSNPDVATVSPTGRVAAVQPGTSQITAACGNYSANVQITVTPPTVARLKTIPERCSLPEGWQKQLTAVVLNPTGEVISEVGCEWSVSDPSVASISEAGVLTAHRSGSAVVAAVLDGKRATCRVLVTLAAHGT